MVGLLAYAERREDAPEDVVGGDVAEDRAHGVEGGAEFECDQFEGFVGRRGVGSARQQAAGVGDGGEVAGVEGEGGTGGMAEGEGVEAVIQLSETLAGKGGE